MSDIRRDLPTVRSSESTLTPTLPVTRHWTNIPRSLRTLLSSSYHPLDYIIPLESVINTNPYLLHIPSLHHFTSLDLPPHLPSHPISPYEPNNVHSNPYLHFLPSHRPIQSNQPRRRPARRSISLRHPAHPSPPSRPQGDSYSHTGSRDQSSRCSNSYIHKGEIAISC